MFIIDNHGRRLHEKIQERIMAPLRPILPDRLIEQWSGRGRRKRKFTVVATFWACVVKHLQKGGSVRSVEDQLAQMGGDLKRGSRDGSAFCQARKRLPVRVFYQALKFLGQWASERSAHFFHEWRVVLVDGTTSVLANSCALKKTFGCPRNQHRESRLPLMRWMVMVGYGSGAVLDAAFAPYGIGEARLFLQLLLRLPSKVLVVADTLFCSYSHIALLRIRGSHVLCPRHATRKEFLKKKLGTNDELHVWDQPRALHVRMGAHLHARLPKQMQMRIIRCLVERKGYRTRKLILCTTLLNPKRYPAKELIALYAKRWEIEGDLRHLKHNHGLDWLKAKQPGTVAREFYSGLLAFNCARAIAVQSGSEPRNLSHSRIQRLISRTADLMASSWVGQLPRLFRDMLQLVSQCNLTRQQRPPEPRVLVRDPRRHYVLGKVDRVTWKKEHAA